MKDLNERLRAFDRLMEKMFEGMPRRKFKGHAIMKYWKRVKHWCRARTVKEFVRLLDGFENEESIEVWIKMHEDPEPNIIALGNHNAGPMYVDFVRQDAWSHTHDFIEKELTDADKGALIVAPILNEVKAHTSKWYHENIAGKTRHTKKFSVRKKRKKTFGKKKKKK